MPHPKEQERNQLSVLSVLGVTYDLGIDCAYRMSEYFSTNNRMPHRNGMKSLVFGSPWLKSKAVYWQLDRFYIQLVTLTRITAHLNIEQFNRCILLSSVLPN
jgi:hypothetical protein